MSSPVEPPQPSRLYALDALCIAILMLAIVPLAQRYNFLDLQNRGWWWGDGQYNLLRSLYLLKGFTLYSDIPSGQFPGTHTLYAAFLWLLGYAKARPAHELLPQIEAAGIYLTGVFQLTIFFLAFRIASLGRLASALASFLLVFVLWESYGQFLPLVESLIVPVTALVVCLLARLTFGPLSESRNTLVLLGCAITFAVVIGLTAAPTFLLWSVFAIGVFAIRWTRCPAGTTQRWSLPVAFWGTVWAAFMFWTWHSIEFKSLIYWTISNPSDSTKISVVENIKTLFTTLPRGITRYSWLEPEVGINPIPPLALRHFGFVAIAMYCLAIWRYRGSNTADRPARNLMIAAFGIVIAIGFVLTGWRYPSLLYNHKAVAALGISIAVLVLALGELIGAANRQQPSFRLLSLAPWVAVLCVGLSIALATLGLWQNRYRAIASERDPGFDAARICRLGNPGPDCYCVLQATFDPRRFLQMDVHPCVGYSPDQPFMISASKQSLDQLWGAVENPNIAFLVGLTSHETTLFKLPLAMYDKIIATRTCHKVDHIFRVCSRPRP
jgi:hypothetical protein